MTDEELYEPRDVTLRKDKPGLWEVGYICPLLEKWTWSHPFAARTLPQARAKGRGPLAALIRESCDRAESRIATMSELAKALNQRATRTLEP